MSHDTIGDLASLLHDGQSYRIRRDPVRRTWLVSLLSERGDVLDYGEAPTLEAALAQLVVTLEAVALIDDRAPMLSAGGPSPRCPLARRFSTQRKGPT